MRLLLRPAVYAVKNDAVLIGMPVADIKAFLQKGLRFRQILLKTLSIGG